MSMATPNAATSKIKMAVVLDFSKSDEPNLGMLLLVRYVAELGQMTFSIKENEIVFRPMHG